ncbi:MAG TPA: glycosyltransferase family 39 protein, partial [Elusimicrobiales bacterium]|nr:glycosyltransferase family 39 protein [Elusimicrobiales bacterium]
MENAAGQVNPNPETQTLYDRLFWAGLTAFAFVLFKLGASRALWDPGESRYAEISREMLEKSDYLVPTLNYVPYFEKPPLGYWLNALAMRIFGVNEFGARFFTIAAGLALAWGLYRFAKSVITSRGALLSVAALGSSLAFFLYCQVNELDMLLSVFVCWALFLFYEGFELRKSPRRNIRLAWALLGLGCLVKGPVALAIPAIIIGPYVLLSGQLRRWRDCRPFEGLLIFLLISAPWFIAISLREPEFFNFFFIREHLQRYTSSTHDRKGSIFYFVPVLLLGVFPWTASFFQPLKQACKQALAKTPERNLALFLLLWAGTIFAFFSVSGSKRPPYMLPAIPPLCLLIAAYWDAKWNTPARELRAAFYIGVSLYAILAAG